MPTAYCPFCRSTKPMHKAGMQLRVGGKSPLQKYRCTNRGCFRITTKPKWRKPRARKEKS